MKGLKGSEVFILELDSNGQILDKLLHEFTNKRESFEYFLYDDYITSTHQNSNNSDGFNTIISKIDLGNRIEFTCVDLKFRDVEMFNISKELIEEDTVWNGLNNIYKWEFEFDFTIENLGSEVIDSFNIISSFFATPSCPSFKFFNIQSSEIKTYQTNFTFIGKSGWIPDVIYFQIMGGDHKLQCDFESASTEITLSTQNSFNSIDKDIFIYPNLTSDLLFIDFPSLSSAGVLNIFALDGKLLLTQNIDKNDRTVSMDLSKFKEGIYFIQFKTKNQNFNMKKLVKNM